MNPSAGNILSTTTVASAATLAFAGVFCLRLCYAVIVHDFVM